MKKIIISLVALAFTFQLNAQSKESVLKTIDKATKVTENPKKASNPASWVKLGNAYMDAFDVPTVGLFQNAPQTQVKLLLKDQKILSSAQEEVNGAIYSVDRYKDKVLYYAENGNLAAWIVTKSIIDGNELQYSLDAFNKAVELDSKGSAAKNITSGLTALQAKYVTEGMNYYTLGKNKEASVNFEKAWEVSSNPLVGKVDTTMAYYAAVTASLSKNSDKAIKLLEYCKSVGFVENGDVYATLADSYKIAGDTIKAKEVLAEGFTAYPDNQGILVALINVYLESNDSPEKVLDILKVAQANEPNNPSLYYAEGNVYKKLNRFDEAVASFKKSAEVDPKYFFAPFSEGDALYSKAIDLQTKAQQELDDAKFAKMNQQMEQALEDAIEPFERAFSIADSDDLKAGCAEYLKQIYFRFRDKKPEYKTSYEKYNEFLNK